MGIVYGQRDEVFHEMIQAFCDKEDALDKYMFPVKFQNILQKFRIKRPHGAKIHELLGFSDMVSTFIFKRKGLLHQ